MRLNQQPPSALLLAALGCLVCLLAACSHYRLSPTYRQVDDILIIPDNYTGFLVVWHECPGGAPITDTGDALIFRYQDDGTICTSDPVMNTRGRVAVQTHSGRHVLALGDLRPETGYGITSGSVFSRAFPHTERMSFWIHWVGDLEIRAAMTDYDEQLDRFLHERFGIEQPRR